MKTWLSVMSHQLTEEQISDARQHYGIERFCELDDEARIAWSQIPTGELVWSVQLRPVMALMRKELHPGDVALIQGEFGATWYLIHFALQLGVLPVYATTVRDVKETVSIDGAIHTERIFRHAGYRSYPACNAVTK